MEKVSGGGNKIILIRYLKDELKPTFNKNLQKTPAFLT